MAITKVYAVRNKLQRAVNYAANEEKTSLDNIIAYAANPAKTERRLFESVINCSSIENAYREMIETKRKFGKEDKVLAYHYIQSFAPDEVTPELAHKIGVEFARECFGDRFEVVIGTHLDKNHLHNHIVVNSVSFADGGKLRSTPESYYNIIRKTSDRLCRENELSVIENPKRKGKHYAEWNAEQQGKPTIRGRMREELDEIIARSRTVNEFWRNLNKAEYVVHRRGVNIAHTSIIPPFGKRPVRIDSLGDAYTEEAIKERIVAARYGIRLTPPSQIKKKYRAKGSLQNRRGKKLHGFIALYFHYLYLFGKVKKRRTSPQVSYYLRSELTKMERYQKQFHFLYERGIETAGQLKEYKSELEDKINDLVEQREKLYIRRSTADESEQTEIPEQISALNDKLKEYRSYVRMCGRILSDAARIQEMYTKAKELQQRKEEKRHEHERRSR